MKARSGRLLGLDAAAPGWGVHESAKGVWWLSVGRVLHCVHASTAGVHVRLDRADHALKMGHVIQTPQDLADYCSDFLRRHRDTTPKEAWALNARNSLDTTDEALRVLLNKAWIIHLYLKAGSFGGREYADNHDVDQNHDARKEGDAHRGPSWM
ncbi:MAG: hypothetical protein ACI9MR_000042 [Myxococcota bacterium]